MKNPRPLRTGDRCVLDEELLLQGLLNSNGHGDGHTDHGVVACVGKAEIYIELRKETHS